MQISSDPNLIAARLDTEISAKVAKKSLDAEKAQGEAALALLEAAAQTGRESVAAHHEQGGIDLLA
ncbi:MAG: hypothetical protein AB7G11_16910 [Phycisphaerales bacterium]